jgi:hypothetical protein
MKTPQCVVLNQPGRYEMPTSDAGDETGRKLTGRGSDKERKGSVSVRPEIELASAVRVGLYSARQFLDGNVQDALDLRIPFDVYFQDPLVAARDPELAFDSDFRVPWEPGLADGPTSSRFAVVDYNGDTEALTPPARWRPELRAFVGPKDEPLDKDHTSVVQFHQVNAWAIVQRTLDYFESGFGLGRRIPWAFEGNRLIIVPHAGYGENAYYDRHSKSLQFYYFERGDTRIDTCLSADIINHELGHAVLDGIRPNYAEALSPETAAFHEFIGDLTAILMIFRNNEFRKKIAIRTGGDLNTDNAIASIGEEFGKHVSDRPYLRTARSPLSMKDVANEQRPHRMSEVLTGAMFDIVLALSRYYVDKRKRTVPQAFWDTIQRMQAMAIQPLDLLPPIDVTFRDYALAVLRAEEVADPTDPSGYREMMLEVFSARGILSAGDIKELRAPHHVFERLDLDVFHDIDTLASSAEAYRFVDDNRRALFIPWNADVTILGPFTAQKLTREARRLPKQIILQYLWREDVFLEGPRFGRYSGQFASLPCGGTLALDQNGNVLAWSRKPGTLFSGTTMRAKTEAEEGALRREAFRDALERRVKAGRIGDIVGGDTGLLARRMAPLTSRTVDGALRFELSPHFGIHDDTDDVLGGRECQISS